MVNLLIHVGHHKTATTWLQKFLFNDSTIGLALPFSSRKILPFLVYPHTLDFDPHACRKRLQSAILEAEKSGLLPVLSSEEFSGNPHSGGYASKELADRLTTVFPEAKILMVIREQKSMIISTYKQYVTAGGSCSLVDYLQPPDRGRQRTPLFDWDHFKYHRLIRYYLNLFGHSKVLVLPYELFRDHPSDFVSQIILFCGLETETEIIETLPYSTKHNESLSRISTALKRCLNPLIGTKSRLNLRPLISTPRANWKLKQYLQELDLVTPSLFKDFFEKKLEAKVFELVGDRYKQSNSFTAKMLNINLTQYGYDL